MSDTLSFTIYGDVNTFVTVTENDDGTLTFNVEVEQGSEGIGDLGGLFFDVADDSLAAGLNIAHDNDFATKATFKEDSVLNLGNGVNMNGAVKKKDAFDVGVKFGTPGIGKDDVRAAEFTLSHSEVSLTLDLIATMRFGARYTSVGEEGGQREDSSKILGQAPENVNDPPDAVDDSATTDEDTPVVVTVLGNDTDPEGDPLTVTSATQGTNGTTTVNPDGTITYTPNDDFNGTDTFDYDISDGNGGTDTATVTVTVDAVNDPPDAVDDSANTDEDTPIVVTVLGNDTDPEGDPLTVTSATQGTNGTTTVNPDGTITYTPNDDFNGTDTFDYDISDGNGGTDTATVTVTVDAVNDPPDAVDDSETTDEDTPVVVTVLGNDTDPEGDPLTVTSATEGTNGTTTVNPDGTITYTPNDDFNGTDTFDYDISDGNGGTDTATVTVTVDAVNDPPDAVDDSETTDEDTPVVVTVLGNDTDPEGDPLTVTSATQGTNGTTTVNPDGTITYTPNDDFNGTDTFDYDISDGNGGTDTATVTVTVDAVNDPPDAVDDSATTDEDTPVVVTVLGNDTDPEGDPLTVTSATQGTNGTTTVNPDGTITYTPNDDFNGTDTFDYDISDGNGGTDTATVTVTVDAVNDPPDAVDDSATTDEDTPVVVTVLGNDTDPEGDPLTVTSATEGTNGTTTVNPDGTITYTPNDDFNGTDTFDYDISDGNGGTDTATVTVTVDAVNDPPDAVDDGTGDPGDDRIVVESGDSTAPIAILANDTDVDGTLDPNSVAIHALPIGGTTLVNADGTVVFTADDIGGDTADDSVKGGFDYTVDDDDGATSNTATATVYVIDPLVETNSDSAAAASNGQQISLSMSSEDRTFNDSSFVNIALQFGDLTQPDVNVSFVLDGSGSIGSQNYEIQLDAVDTAIGALRLQFAGSGQDVEIQLVQFSGDQDVSLSNPEAFSASFDLFDTALDDVTAGGTPLTPYLGDFTNYEAGLDDAVEFFTGQASDENFLIFVSDGQPNRAVDPTDEDLGISSSAESAYLDEVSELQNSLGVSISAFGIGSNIDLGTLNPIDNTGGAEILDDFTDLADALTASPIFAADVLEFKFEVNGVDQGAVVGDLVDIGGGDKEYSLASISGLNTGTGATNTFKATAGFDTDNDGVVDETRTVTNTIEWVDETDVFAIV